MLAAAERRPRDPQGEEGNVAKEFMNFFLFFLFLLCGVLCGVALFCEFVFAKILPKRQKVFQVLFCPYQNYLVRTSKK